MRIGSISQGKTKCDSCGLAVPYAERYLIVKEKDDIENEEGELRRYCVKCARDRGYVRTRVEKGETIVTFFPEAAKLIETKTEGEGEGAQAEKEKVPGERAEKEEAGDEQKDKG
ncbi:MAG: hypothetical protein Q8O43_02645 [Dehalococcoidia bacterium]|nr:hypothetical protein [Dehalococcoidia bacterium]